MADRDSQRARELMDVPPKRADPSTWPAGVRTIGLEELDALGVDKADHLYWHGKPIEIRQRLELRWIELILLLFATIGALLQGVAAMFPFIPNAINAWWAKL